MTDDQYGGRTLTPERLGQLAFLASVPVFAYVGHLVFDDVLFGGLVGLAVGAGEFLFVPYVIESGADDGTVAAVDADDVRRATVGIPLASGAMVAFAGRFVVDGYLLPFAAAGLYATAVYVPLHRFLSAPERDEATA